MEDKMFELMTKMYGEFNKRFDNIENRFNNLENEVKDIKTIVKKIEVKIEQNIEPKLQSLFDGYVQNTSKLDRIQEEVTKQEEVIIRRIK